MRKEACYLSFVDDSIKSYKFLRSLKIMRIICVDLKFKEKKIVHKMHYLKALTL